MSVIVTPLQDNKYALVEDYEYKEITVPKGYETNGAGFTTLNGALSRVRVTTVNGTDTFDVGQINIMYEG